MSLPANISEDELAVQAKTDEAAFSKLYEMYLPKIFAFVTRRINDRDEAEDLVSNIFLKWLTNRTSFNPKRGSFKTFLYTIATRTMIDYFRTREKKTHEKIEMAEDVADPEKNPHETASQNQEKFRVHRVIDKLPERHQKVIMLKFFSDLSTQEIAEALGVTENNAGVMIHRALAAFELVYQHYV